MSRKADDDTYCKIEFSTFILSKERKDKWFLNQNSEIVEMIFAKSSGTGIRIYGRKLEHFEDHNEKPFLSRHLNIYSADIKFEIPKFYSIEDIKFKLVCLHPYDTECRQNNQFFNTKKGIFFPLIHTL